MHKDVGTQSLKECYSIMNPDSVMFLSTTTNNDMIEQCINYIPKTTLTDDIIGFDPFVNKKGKRSFILSWLCLRPCLIKWQSIDEYKNVLK